MAEYTRPTFSDEEALKFHSRGKPGKIEMTPTKPMATQRDLSLAYSPGGAAPVKAIAEDPDKVWDYTARGNMVAVISNGTAILGLGNLGALASKPVMEGKAVLFKRFADVDAFDLELDVSDPDAFIAAVRALGPSFGGINLEDIKAPESFVIERTLKEQMDIPVFHDDQHGTAIITAAGFLNALEITGKRLDQVKVAAVGAGSAGLAVLALLKHMGVPHENCLLCDRNGVLHLGRNDLDEWRRVHAVETDKRTLSEAMDGADVFIGLSGPGAVTPDMIRNMARNPVIFAMANPDPEIRPEAVQEIRGDAIMATGRSDYPNQVNNVLGFPYIFRGALDVRATAINEEMKVAAARALAELAREDVPDEVAAAYHGSRPRFGPDYIIPVPFDPRLISTVPVAVAKAAFDSGVARRPIMNMTAYKHDLAARLDPTASFIQRIAGAVRQDPKRVVFAEGEEDSVIRAALAFYQEGLGQPILIAREERVLEALRRIGAPDPQGLEIHNARLSDRNPDYAEFLYKRLQRQGFLFRDCQRFVNNDRNIFAACMVAFGHADAMVTGATRSYDIALSEVMRVVDPRPGERVIGMSVLLAKNRTLFVADTNVVELPNAQELADIACEAAHTVKRLGFEPRVAFLAYSTFGNPPGERSDKVREAVRLLDERGADFEYEGEMNADVALDPSYRRLYPFSRLTGPANVLVMPAIHSASIATKLIAELEAATVIGPILLGLDAPIQIVNLGARVTDIVNMAAMAAYDMRNPVAEGDPAEAMPKAAE